jgi:hypothetical protein
MAICILYQWNPFSFPCFQQPNRFTSSVNFMDKLQACHLSDHPLLFEPTVPGMGRCSPHLLFICVLEVTWLSGHRIFRTVDAPVAAVSLAVFSLAKNATDVGGSPAMSRQSR